MVGFGERSERSERSVVAEQEAYLPHRDRQLVEPSTLGSALDEVGSVELACFEAVFRVLDVIVVEGHPLGHVPLEPVAHEGVVVEGQCFGQVMYVQKARRWA